MNVSPPSNVEEEKKQQPTNEINLDDCTERGSFFNKKNIELFKIVKPSAPQRIRQITNDIGNRDTDVASSKLNHQPKLK